MARKPGTYAPNTAGLKESARKKSAETVRRFEQSVQKLLRERQPINFSSVARTAKVSVAWLYKVPQVRQRIEHLRGTHHRAKFSVPQSERISDAGLRAQNNALKKRNQELANEIVVLRARIGVAFGMIASNNLPIPD